jgi:hypothetical protein
MRLLDVDTMKLYTFCGDAIPKDAILSHRWLSDDEEVTFQQIQTPITCRSQEGFRKIELLCKQAKLDNCRYAWIDTCCIDKTNNSELSEAINSMFAYLTDVNLESGNTYLRSKWWARAWYVMLMNKSILPIIN